MRIQLFSCPFLLILCSIYAALVRGDCLGDGSICQEDQISFLLRLRNTLHFDVAASSKLVSWNPTTDCCCWGGVTWDSTGYVIGLDLSNEYISGGFNGSSSLFSLQHLQSLNLAYNNFRFSQIPSEIGEIGHLIYLNLSNAGFAGQIPVEISRLRKLVTMDFSILYFPEVPLLRLENPDLRMLVQNLTELRELYLDGVNISAQGKEWCRALSDSVPNLRVLSLQSCGLSGPLDSSLLKLRSLSSISLSGNYFSAPVPDFLTSFSNLTDLRLSSSGLYGTCPEKIFQVPTLHILDLSYNKLLRGSLPELPQDGSLQTLVLLNTNFSGQLPNSVGNLKRLTRIELADCNFIGEIPNSITGLTQLVYLDFSNNKFSGPLPRFSLSKNLTEIHLSHNYLTGPIPSSHLDGLVNLVTLDLRYNSLNGSLPMRLFSLPALQMIRLRNNRFSGPFSEFSVLPSCVLDTLDLSGNILEGPIPETIFDLQHLITLDLSSNKFNGTVELTRFQKLGNLSDLGLSYNNLSITARAGNPTSHMPLNLFALKLSSCRLTTFPDLSTLPRLAYLDLSDNQISGTIPSWIWKIGNGTLQHLNLSHNLLQGLQEPFSTHNSYLFTLDLHSNQLHGQIPTPPPFSLYVDYSDNQFNYSIPDGIGTYMSYSIFFSLSNNAISGSIPDSICNASYLKVLDFSENAFSGNIPTCLLQIEALGVLNLGENKLIGTIPEEVSQKCNLRTLDLHKNHLEGTIPKSLANCKELEILNVGNNRIEGTFPCWLKNIASLRVLVLRRNKFHGPIGCPQNNPTWAMLQILDLAHNNFSGNLSEKSLLTWTTMMSGGNEVGSKLEHLQFRVLQLTQLYYQDAVTVTSKGIEIELVKVLTIFTSIDLSGNNFEGEIPEVIGNFTSLHALNLSHNGFTGQIPSFIGNLQQLESLDLSGNRLSGEIPTQLASLNFLSVLNLSSNQLVGEIPTGNQLQTCSENSFMDNRGLCGFPLNVSCREARAPTFDGLHSGSRREIKWEYIAPEVGFVTGLGMVIWPLVLCRRWRRCYYKHVDRVLSRILHSKEQRSARAGRRAQTIQRRRL